LIDFDDRDQNKSKMAEETVTVLVLREAVPAPDDCDAAIAALMEQLESKEEIGWAEQFTFSECARAVIIHSPQMVTPQMANMVGSSSFFSFSIHELD